MNYLRHIILFTGILVIVTFFVRISRNALNDGFFAKIEELNTRNSQEWDRVQINIPSDNQDGIVSSSHSQVQIFSFCGSGLLNGFVFRNIQPFTLIVKKTKVEWMLQCLRDCIPGFAQAP